MPGRVLRRGIRWVKWKRQRSSLRLHRKGDPLILFNIWDAGSAKVVTEAGAKALATGSWSVAAANGFGDGEAIPLSLLAVITRLDFRDEPPAGFCRFRRWLCHRAGRRRGQCGKNHGSRRHRHQFRGSGGRRPRRSPARGAGGPYPCHQADGRPPGNPAIHQRPHRSFSCRKAIQPIIRSCWTKPTVAPMLLPRPARAAFSRRGLSTQS